MHATAATNQRLTLAASHAGSRSTEGSRKGSLPASACPIGQAARATPIVRHRLGLHKEEYERTNVLAQGRAACGASGLSGVLGRLRFEKWLRRNPARPPMRRTGTPLGDNTITIPKADTNEVISLGARITATSDEVPAAVRSAIPTPESVAINLERPTRKRWLASASNAAIAAAGILSRAAIAEAYSGPVPRNTQITPSTAAKPNRTPAENLLTGACSKTLRSATVVMTANTTIPRGIATASRSTTIPVMPMA